ncbi:amino acid transporter, putative [Perkinsus marinus ATCC 50983]|uniref:Amino acid transporter, putative n=1 Tax=Perkinsus marinus (strain ATCC 50983 / TXsc) TaxID=423536 RepID=C5LXI0_PERM5|nr:amino acid transporter, putative [Perkinsus marinus ATCC 50983]EEQ98562.1 amino acid transporter, putative [Perkinsus marinus ATCC 50983]|eukprot:XP_002765845.1 amino acid transporter, putative [Perkinsus marinus ATCC 50983]
MLGSGLLVGILCFVICACIAVTSNLILFTAVTKTGLHTYGAVVDWALVRLGFKKADLLAAVGQQAEGNAPYYSISPLGVSPRLAFFELWAFVYCVMTCVSYLVFLGDFIPSITGYYLQGIDPEVFRKFCIVACAYLAIYPMSVSKSISVLRYVSSLSIWAVVLTATVVLIRAPSLVEEHPEEARASLSLSESHVNMSTFNTFAVCMFGLMNQIPAVRVAAEMSRPTTVRRTIANVVAGVALSSIYLSMAIAVYLSFLTDTKPNFMQNYAADDRIIFVCRIGLTIMLLVAAPMNLLPGLAGFYKALELGAGEGSVGDVPVRNPFFVFCRWIESVVGVQSLLMQYGAPFFSITVCTAIALLVPNVASFIGSMSSYLAAPLVCGFPGLVYAALQKDDDIGKKRWPLLTIALVFITLLLWVTATINIFFS